jgi:dTDP-4-amino-4,6-dideoxygalactose transaminase
MGKSVRKKIIPIAKPYFDEKEIKATAEVLSSGWIVQGPKVKEFERLVQTFQGCRHAVATTSATASLHLALIALGIGEGDEVIVPAFTHPSTANMVRHVGAFPVFVDIKLPDFNIDPSKIEGNITKKTRAIIPVHLFGLPADMDPIMEVARDFKLKVVEDAACALGSVYKGRKVGGIGDCGAFSFHPRKSITTGEGGMVTTNNQEIADRVKMLRSHGESLSDEFRHKADEIVYPDFLLLGLNYRMTDIQAAIGVKQMEKLPHILAERRKIAMRYNKLLSDLAKKDFLFLPPEGIGSKHSYQSYVVLFREKMKRARDRLSNELQKKGIATRKGTYHVPGTKYYRQTFAFKKGDFPNSETADEKSLALPLYVGMEKGDIDYVVDNLKDLIRRGS